MKTYRALLLTDLLVDFCEGGSLPAPGGTTVAERVAELLSDPVVVATYDEIIILRDYHIDPDDHFAPEGVAPNYVTTWPVHCPAGGPGGELHPAVKAAVLAVATAEFRKGQYAAAYSGFEGTLSTDDITGLEEYLRARGITDVDVLGLCTDHCVKATALDSQAAGFVTSVLLEFSAGVAPDTTAAAIAELAAAGVTLVADPNVAETESTVA